MTIKRKPPKVSWMGVLKSPVSRSSVPLKPFQWKNVQLRRRGWIGKTLTNLPSPTFGTGATEPLKPNASSSKRRKDNGSPTILKNKISRKTNKSKTIHGEKAPGTQRTRRKALEALYQQLWHLVPDMVRDPVTGVLWPREAMERHHPAGRRKAAFLYTIMVTQETHQRIHANGEWAESVGLLWPGRNSKVFTLDDARFLAQLRPVKFTYPEDIYSSVTP